MDEKFKPVSNIYDGQYFNIVSRDNDILVVRCNICGPDGPQLRASTKSNGNILKHIQRRHPSQMEQIKAEKNIKSRLPRPSKKYKIIKKELNVDHQPLNDPIEIITYGDMEPNEHTDDDDLHGDCVIPTEDLLMDSKPDEYSNADTEIELHDDRNYDVTDVELYEQEMPYEQNELQANANQAQQRQQQHQPQPIRHFQSGLNSSADRLRHDKELVDFQKQLMQKEFDEVRAMRQEKHKLEMQILSAELKHKFIEHQKQLEFLNKRILQDI